MKSVACVERKCEAVVWVFFFFVNTGNKLKVTSYYHQVMTKSLKVPSLYIIIVLAFDTDFILGLNKVKGKGKCGGKCFCLFHIIITSVLTTLTVFLPSLVPLHTVAHHWPTCCECAAGCNV